MPDIFCLILCMSNFVGIPARQRSCQRTYQHTSIVYTIYPIWILIKAFCNQYTTIAQAVMSFVILNSLENIFVCSGFLIGKVAETYKFYITP